MNKIERKAVIETGGNVEVKELIETGVSGGYIVFTLESGTVKIPYGSVEKIVHHIDRLS